MNDYAQDTQHLSLLEHGAYSRLLDYYYEQRKALPLDELVLFRVCRAFTPDEQGAVKTVLSQFFKQQSDGWHQKRADEEIAKANQISAVKSKAARIRHGRTEATKPEGIAEAGTVEGERSVDMHMQSTCNAGAPARAPARGHAAEMHVDPQITDHRSIENNSQIINHKPQTEMARADKPRATTRIKVCDDGFLAELQSKEAYRDLNVRNVYSKMVAYCELRGKQPTRGRLLNWLNREDRPMGNGNGNSNTAGYQTAPERRDAALHRRLNTIAELQGRGNGSVN